VTDIEDRLVTVPSLVDDFIYGEGTIEDLQDAIEILEDTIKEVERRSHLTRAELEKEWEEKYLPPWVGLKWKKL